MRDEILYLCDIFESLEMVSRFTRNVSRESFIKDEVLKSAVLLKLLVIGEAASHLSNDLKMKYPDIPWKVIISFRNRSIHSYFNVNWEIVWDTATIDAPVLWKHIAQVLSEEYPDTYEKYFGRSR